MSSQLRDELFYDQKQRLEELAYRALQKGKSPKEFLVIVLQVDDEIGGMIARVLMPGEHNEQEWERQRQLGATPVARGTVPSNYIEPISQMAPSVAHVFTQPLPQGMVWAVVIGYDGVSVFQIEPMPEHPPAMAA